MTAGDVVQALAECEPGERSWSRKGRSGKYPMEAVDKHTDKIVTTFI